MDWEEGEKGNSMGRTHPTCSKPSNDYGLCDMSGNVWEWVWDYYDENYYLYLPKEVTFPTGPGKGKVRIDRGGGWNVSERYQRVYYRDYLSPFFLGSTIGFRLVRFR